MKQNSPKKVSPLAGIVCGTLGHSYVITRQITHHINEYECANCGKEVTNNFSGAFENLTIRNRQVNTSLSSLFQKKQRRSLSL